MTLGARYFPACSSPREMVIKAALAFREDTGRYPTHVALNRFHRAEWDGTQMRFPVVPLPIVRALPAPELAEFVAPPRVQEVARVYYADDVPYGWVICIHNRQLMRV